MANTDQARKKREAEAFAREEEHRAERRKIEAREREREKKDQERRRLTEMAIDKQQAKKVDEEKKAEAKQEAWLKELEQKKYKDAEADAYNKIFGN
jgi:hypothetical protein